MLVLLLLLLELLVKLEASSLLATNHRHHVLRELAGKIELPLLLWWCRLKWLSEDPALVLLLLINLILIHQVLSGGLLWVLAQPSSPSPSVHVLRLILIVESNELVIRVGDITG